MPYLSPAVGDPVVWVTAGGVYLPAQVYAAGSRNGTVKLCIQTAVTVDEVTTVTPSIVSDALYSKPTDGISAASTYHWPQES